MAFPPEMEIDKSSTVALAYVTFLDITGEGFFARLCVRADVGVCSIRITIDGLAEVVTTPGTSYYSLQYYEDPTSATMFELAGYSDAKYVRVWYHTGFKLEGQADGAGRTLSTTCFWGEL